MSAVADRLREVAEKLSDLEQWVRQGYAYLYVEVEDDSYGLDLGVFGEQEISVTVVREEYEVDPEAVLSSANGSITSSGDLDRLVDELNEAADEIDETEAADEIPTVERIKELAEALAGTLTGTQRQLCDVILAGAVALIGYVVPDEVLTSTGVYRNGTYDEVVSRFDYENTTHIATPTDLPGYQGERSLIVGDDVEGVGLVTAVIDKPDGTRVITYGGVSISSQDSNEETPYDKVLEPGDNGNQWYWNRPTPKAATEVMAEPEVLRVRADEVRLGDTIYPSGVSGRNDVVTEIDGGDGSIRDEGANPVRLITKDGSKYTRRRDFLWDVIRRSIDTYDPLTVEVAPTSDSSNIRTDELRLGDEIYGFGRVVEVGKNSNNDLWSFTCQKDSGARNTYSDWTGDTVWTGSRAIIPVGATPVIGDAPMKYDPLTVEVSETLTDVRARDLRIGDNFGTSTCRVTALTYDADRDVVKFVCTYDDGSTSSFEKNGDHIYSSIRQAIIPVGATPAVAVAA